MNINKLFPFFMLMLFAGLLYGAGGSSHADPMAILNGNHHSNDSQKITSTPQEASRHFSPLEAMSGRIIAKKTNNGQQPDTNKQKMKKTNSRKTPIKKNITPELYNDGETRLDYSIENIEEVPSGNGANRVKQKENIPPRDNQNTQKIKSNSPMISPADDISIDVTHNNDELKRKSAPRRKPSKKKSTQTKDSQMELIGSESPATIELPPSGKVNNAHKKKQYHTNKNKTLYMTFDDGPCAGTANLLRVISEEGVSATMFYIGRNVDKRHNLFKRAVSNPNVLVANHTYSHANNHYRKFYSGSIKNVVNDIDRAQGIIGGAKYLRLAGRNVWRIPSASRNDWGISVAHRSKEIDKYDALKNRGYYIYGWDAEWNFSHKTQRPLFGGEEMARRVNLIYNSGKNLKKGKIVLLAHDYLWKRSKDLAKLRTFIRIMKADGWKFATIDTYSNSTPEVLAKKKFTDKNPEELKPAQEIAKKAKVVPGVSEKLISAKKDSHRSAKTSQNRLALLCKAIEDQDFMVIRKLLASGVNINKKNSKGELPLNIAIKTNNAVLVKILVERGARIFNIDAYGMSPMGIARQYQNPIIIKYLIRQIDKQKKQRLRHTLFAMR